MKKLLILLILCLSSAVTYAADEAITADSTVDGNITNNWWNVEVKWDHTLVEGDINAKAWDNIVIDNDDCLKYPEKCKKDVSTTSSNWDTAVTPTNSDNNINSNTVVPTSSTTTSTEVAMLPKTWPAENILIIVALLVWGLFIFRKKIFNI